MPRPPAQTLILLSFTQISPINTRMSSKRQIGRLRIQSQRLLIQDPLLISHHAVHPLHIFLLFDLYLKIFIVLPLPIFHPLQLLQLSQMLRVVVYLLDIGEGFLCASVLHPFQAVFFHLRKESVFGCAFGLGVSFLLEGYLSGHGIELGFDVEDVGIFVDLGLV